MKPQRDRRSCLAALIPVTMAALMLLFPAARAQENKEKKPAAPAKSAPKAGAPATNPATRGPATGAAGGATAGRGATTEGAPAGRGPAAGAAGGRGATPGANAGRGPAAGAGGGRGVAERGPAPGGRGNVSGHPQPANARVERRPNGNEVSRRVDGRPRDVHVARAEGGMDVHHGLGGGRRVEVERGDHSRIVAERGGHGYVQHPYAFRGHEFAHRTYYVNGRAYDRFYGRYEYRPGVFVEVYAPVRYYPVGFYGWAYNPWVAPVPYAWGWAGNPWYGYYGAYFTPYPVYATASLWLTDYLISQSLAAAYQAQVDAQLALTQPLPQGQVVLTPDVKQMIADEVRRQVALENAEAQANAQNADFNAQSSGIARMLADNLPHVFVVGADLDLVDASGQECAVSQGDVLQFSPTVPLTADGASLIVLTSKGGLECRRGLTVSATFVDLQNMQNHMRETVDAGLADLQSHKGGLPTPPPSAAAPATQASFAVSAPPPDPNAAAQINQQFQEADKAEQDTLNEGSGSGAMPSIPAPAAPPPTVTLGMTTDQVAGILGQPKTVMDLGAKKIYVYPELKVTFQDGKVTNME